MSTPLIPQSKLPALGTTIFTQMSALAQRHQAINLSQGFPDFDGPDYLKSRLAWHVSQGANQYAPMTGVAPLREAIAVSSFGKTYHMTGWKVGYCVAPPALSAEVRKIHQYLTFAVNTPAQLALADMLRQEPAHWQTLPAFYRQRRDHLVRALAPSRLKLLPCEGTYFLLADYSAVSDKDDVAFCQWLTTQVGVAAIPLSVFCAAPFPHKLIRLCFAKGDQTLDAAAERLCRL